MILSPQCQGSFGLELKTCTTVFVFFLGDKGEQGLDGIPGPSGKAEIGGMPGIRGTIICFYALVIIP